MFNTLTIYHDICKGEPHRHHESTRVDKFDPQEYIKKGYIYTKTGKNCCSLVNPNERIEIFVTPV